MCHDASSIEPELEISAECGHSHSAATEATIAETSLANS